MQAFKQPAFWHMEFPERLTALEAMIVKNQGASVLAGVAKLTPSKGTER
jgi:hypothetical protein